MIGLDANVLLRALIDSSVWPDDHPGQRTAAGRLLSRPDQRFHVNAVTLSEVLWVLIKPMQQPRAHVLHVLGEMLKAPNIEVQSRPAIEAALSRLEHSNEPVHDALIAELDRAAGCRHTLTFDRKASRRDGFKLLPASG